jgi:hypothetical protein
MSTRPCDAPPASVLLAAGLALALGACTSAPSRPEGLWGWEQDALLRWEKSLASSAARLHDPALISYLEALALRLDPDRAPLRIYVLMQDSALAELRGNQALLLHSGLVLELRDEDELVFVLAHELAHRALGHLAARRGSGWNAAEAEREADASALGRIVPLGYDERAASTLVERLLQAATSPSTRDALASRLERLPKAGVTTRPPDIAFERAVAALRARRPQP